MPSAGGTQAPHMKVMRTFRPVCSRAGVLTARICGGVRLLLSAAKWAGDLDLAVRTPTTPDGWKLSQTVCQEGAHSSRAHWTTCSGQVGGFSWRGRGSLVGRDTIVLVPVGQGQSTV